MITSQQLAFEFFKEQIEVGFDIDSNGIVHVSAKDLGTGKEQSIKITGKESLSDEDIKKMTEDAKKYEASDAKKKAEVDLINQANAMVYSTEKMLVELKDKVDKKEAELISGVNNDLKKLLEADKKDIDKVKQKVEELTKLSQEMSTKLYQKEEASKEKAKETEGKKKKKEDEPIDAEYKVKDKKKK